MITETTDEVAAASSTATGSDAVQSQEAHEDTSASTNGAPDGNSPPSEKTGLDEFTELVAKRVAEDQPAEIKSEEEASATTDETAEIKPEEEVAEALSQEKTVPIHQTPKWKKFAAAADKVSPELGKEMRQYMRESFEANQTLRHQVAELQPAVEVVNELRQSVGGSEQGLQNVRLLVRNFDADPRAAVPMLETLLTDARKRAGLVLQSPELLTEAQQLDQQVRDGVIESTQADKRKAELLKLQQAEMVTSQTQAQREQAQREAKQGQDQAAQAKIVEELNQTEANWVAQKQKSDPDFKAVQNLYNIFAQQNALEFFNKNQRIATPAESVKILEKSLSDAKAEAGKFRPKPKAKAAISGGSNGSSGNNRQQPANDFDAFKELVEVAVERNKP